MTISSANGEHPCETPGCELTVMYDDEPHCFKHSPDSGSYVQGYSYKKKLWKKLQEEQHNYWCYFALDQDDSAPGEHEWDADLEYCVLCELPYSQWSEPTEAEA